MLKFYLGLPSLSRAQEKGWDNRLCKLALQSPQVATRLVLKKLDVGPLAAARRVCQAANRCTAAQGR